MSALSETNATIESILVSTANRKEELQALIDLARRLAERIDAETAR